MLYYDKELYREAINNIDQFCLYILDDLSDFAVKNDYDKEWVIERFQEQFQKVKMKNLKRR